MAELTDLLARWGLRGPVQPLDTGLINTSYEVAGGYVLQRVNLDIFLETVNGNIERVTTHLEARGLPTPRLVRTEDGALDHRDHSGLWRVLTRVGDRTLEVVPDLGTARRAGALVARFHEATRDFDDQLLPSRRRGGLDTQGYMDALTAALDGAGDHPLAGEARLLGARILESWQRWHGPGGLPRRLIHGDLKLSNLRWSGSEAHALIDLDTLAWGTLDKELGDAFRSWCNPAGEDAPGATFRGEFFLAAMEGYLAGTTISEAELLSLIPGTRRIALELASRFCADAVEESYFGWDRRRYDRAGRHHLARAHTQFGLAEDLDRKAGELELALSRLV